MSLGRSFKRLVLWTVLLTIAMFGIAVSSPLFLIATLALGVLGWWLTEGPLKAPLPRLLIYILTGVALVYGVFDALEGGVSPASVCEAAVYVQLVTLYDRKGPRAYAQLLTVSVFLVIGSMLTSNSFLLGPLLLVLLPVLSGAVMMYQLYGAQVRVRSAQAEVLAAVGGAGPPAPGSGRRTARHLRAVIAATTAASFVGALAVFVLAPRGVGANRFGQWRNPGLGAMTGFTDHIDIGNAAPISESAAVVLDLAVRKAGALKSLGSAPRFGGGEGAGTLEFGGTGSVFYLRGAVLEDRGQGRWTRGGATSGPGWLDIDIESGVGRSIGSDGNGIAIEQTVTIRNAGREQWPLFSIWRPVRVAYAQGAGLIANPGNGTLIRRGPPGRVEYTVRSIIAEPDREEAPVRRLLRVNAPVIREFTGVVLAARSIPADPAERSVEDDAEAARVIERYLRENCRYTLEGAPVPVGRDPTEWFLLEGRIGHCEHFASAMATMCRTVGINARVIAGYVAADYNPITRRYVVRERNAHAWVEVETQRGRWSTFDPTPSADFERIHRPNSGTFGWAGRLVEAFEHYWNNAVVAFDDTSQGGSLRAGEGGAGVARQLERLAVLLRASRHRGLKGAALALVPLAAVGVTGAVLMFATRGVARVVRSRLAGRRAIRRASVGDPDYPARVAQAEFYRQLLALLADLGHAKPAWSPPLAHAATFARARPEVSDLAARAVALYYELRFGRRLLSARELEEARGLVRAIASRARSDKAAPAPR